MSGLSVALTGSIVICIDTLFPIGEIQLSDTQRYMSEFGPLIHAIFNSSVLLHTII
jgi:hypothetical protein